MLVRVLLGLFDLAAGAALKQPLVQLSAVVVDQSADAAEKGAQEHVLQVAGILGTVGPIVSIVGLSLRHGVIETRLGHRRGRTDQNLGRESLQGSGKGHRA